MHMMTWLVLPPSPAAPRRSLSSDSAQGANSLLSAGAGAAREQEGSMVRVMLDARSDEGNSREPQEASIPTQAVLEEWPYYAFVGSSSGHRGSGDTRGYIS